MEKIKFSYKKRGEYAYQVRRYFDTFERGQIKVIKSEDMFRNTNEVLKQVMVFLGIGLQTLHNKKIHHTIGDEIKVDAKGKEFLNIYYKKYNKKLYDLLRVENEWW